MNKLKKRIDHIIEEKEWLDERVSQIFSKYCEIFDIHRRYGIHNWEIWGNKLDITQDISCRGCFDTARHILSIDYLYSDNYEALIEQDFKDQQEKQQKEKKEKEVLTAHKLEEKDRIEYERLKAKFEGGQ